MNRRASSNENGLEQHKLRLKKLYELSIMLSGDPVEVFKRVAEIIGELFDVRVVCLSEIRGDKLHFTSVYVDGSVIMDAGECPIDITPCATVEASKDLIIYEKVSELFPEASFLRDHDAYSYCGFPSIDSHGNVVAVTCLLDDKPHQFDADDQELLCMLGQRIALEIERKTYFEAREKAERDREETLLELIQTRKMEALGILAGGVAHDFNNLLTSIRGYSELGKEQVGQDGPIYSTFDEILKASDLAANLTRQLLYYSRRQPMQTSSIDVSDVLSEISDMLRRIIGDNISLHTNFASPTWLLLADVSSIKQLIMNLVINAKDAMPDGGKITIGTNNVVLGPGDFGSGLPMKAEKYVRISVSDTGGGMSEDVLENIFDPFFTTKGPTEGTGLGLAVVQGIVQQHLGRVDVDSQPQKGTTFHILLPAATSEAVQPEEARPSCRQPEPRARILVVEDNPTLRKFVMTVLERDDKHVTAVATLQEAMAQLEQHGSGFSLVFSDVMLPDGTGIQLAAHILDNHSNLPVLLTSGFPDGSKGARKIQEQHIPFLQKPYTIEALLAKITELTSRSRAN